MGERREAAAYLRLKRRVDAGHDHAGPGGALGDDLAPGIDHHAVPVRAPAVRVLASLGRGEHPREVLDRAGAQQRLPMRAPRGRGEGRGNEDDVHRRERAIELGKAHVVAHRKRDAPEGRFDCTGLGARFYRSRLVEALRSELQPEQMDLVVARDAPSIRVVDEAAVSHLARIVARERHRASHEPHAVPPRRLPEELLDRPGAVLLLRGHLVRVAHAENAEILGMRDTDKVAAKEKDGAGPIQEFLGETARRHGVWLVGGSVPLACDDPGKVRNSCLVYDADGRRVARYDKIHLFGLELGAERFDEARTIEAGTQPCAIESPFGRIALSVCYDVLFPELYRSLAPMQLILVPSALTSTT